MTDNGKAFLATAAAIHAAIGDEKCSHDALGDDCWHLARAALAAAWPVLAAALADHIEAQERLPHAMQRYVRFTDVALLRACVAASVPTQGEK